jgi:hypothetical protein
MEFGLYGVQHQKDACPELAIISKNKEYLAIIRSQELASNRAE